MKEEKGTNKAPGTEDKITALLQLRAKLEQELRADTRKLEDLKKECDLKLRWIRYLDEILSEASFQPASTMIQDMQLASPEPDDEDKTQVVDVKSFDEPVHIKDQKDGTILATVNFIQGNIMIIFNDALQVIPESRIFQEFFQKHIVNVFEKEGGKIYLEHDDEKGILRSISIMGSFSTDLKEQVIKRLTQSVVAFREASKASS
nr:hypothetical protein [Candidatus Sigynarchaeota archaeon]